MNGKPAPGFVTTHDSFAIAFSKQELIQNISGLLNSSTEQDARKMFRLCKQKQWNYRQAKQHLLHSNWRENIKQCLYRPFDIRWTVYDSHVCVHRRERVSKYLVDEKNIAIICSRMTKGDNFHHVFATDKITEVICLSSKTSANAFVFPLYVQDAQTNINPDIVIKYQKLVETATY